MQKREPSLYYAQYAETGTFLTCTFLTFWSSLSQKNLTHRITRTIEEMFVILVLYNSDVNLLLVSKLHIFHEHFVSVLTC